MMPRIRRNDPARRHLHDYVVVDPDTGRDLAGFDNQDEAMVFAAEHLRGVVTLLQVHHPNRCGCKPGRGVYPDGSRLQVPV
jgi:hypothetical protein